MEKVLEEIVRLIENDPDNQYKYTDFVECTDYTRTLIKYMKLDIEALRRENVDLLQRLEAHENGIEGN